MEQTALGSPVYCKTKKAVSPPQPVPLQNSAQKMHTIPQELRSAFLFGG